MAKYVAAVDQGTTSTRCMLFDHDGGVVSVYQKEHEQIYPKAGWVEHDPMEIWERTQEVVKGALAKAGTQPGDIAAVGITNQRETTVVWNKNTGEPYYNAIVWQDTGDAVFGNIDTWVIWWLTGGPNGGSHVTDVSNASRTMLMNLETLDWDDEILGIMGIPRQMLPKVVPSSDPNTWGNTPADGPFGDSIPVCGDLGDQQAALVGQTCYSPGEAKNTYGTGCFMLMNTGTEIVPSASGLLTTLGYKIGDEPAVYCLEGSIAITGALVQWLRDNLNFFDFSHHIEDYAKQVDDAGGIYFVPAFSGLFAPYWQSDARGVIVGMTRYVNKNHICRAALEATAYQTREVLDAMEKDSGVTLKALKVDGGMVYNQLLMQFQSDILGVPVVRPQVAETTALGAAYAAGLAVGFWDNLEDLRQNWLIDYTWDPDMGDAERDQLYQGWLKAVQRSMGWVE